MKKTGLVLLSGLLGASVGMLSIGRINKKAIVEKNKRIDKFKSYYNLLNQWMYLRQENKSLAEYFKKNNYNRIAIYGLGELGNHLIDELKNTEIKIVYGIDKSVDSIFGDIQTFSLEEIDRISEDVDVIVVTAVFAFEEIEKELIGKIESHIISLDEIVFEI